MHVCHLITGLNQAGAQNLLLDLIRTDDTVDHSICYLVEDSELGTATMAPQFQAAGVTVYSLEVASLLDVPFALHKFHRIISGYEFDVIHLHLTHAILSGRIVAFFQSNTPVVTTHHNVPDPSPTFRNLERVTRFVDDVTVAVSDGVAAAFNDTDPFFTSGSIDRVIYNGIDVADHRERVKNANVTEIYDRHGFDRSDIVYLNIARYVPQKRQDLLIHAMDNLSEHSHLLLVGSGGDQEEELRQLAVELEVTDRVSITGPVESVAPYFAAADVFVLPSIHEGLPITLLEAMASGLPVVATDIPGVREVVDEHATGELVMIDDIADLSGSMKRMFNDSYRTRLGRQGYNRARYEYNIDTTQRKYLNVYDQVLS